ncbi:hypothetical protein P7K49_013217 [Saguinus oedipus]|uniref:Uncharacterized protein n=1 Tax=Saguinus oedipus TaxID=9490 RepID=A0ABQ9VI62_SAGOE|nr:hypothetical protein P7K49_013217 [Saguinus oedipus]
MPTFNIPNSAVGLSQPSHSRPRGSSLVTSSTLVLSPPRLRSCRTEPAPEGTERERPGRPPGKAAWEPELSPPSHGANVGRPQRRAPRSVQPPARPAVGPSCSE